MDTIIEHLRAQTRPIHEKLDNDGIGGQMKSGKFQAAEYKTWLASTWQINSFLYNEKEHFKDSEFYKYVDDDLGLGLIEKDNDGPLPESNSVSSLQSFHQDNDYLIAIVYTYLGSTLGSTYIHRYVQKNIPEASTLFLKHMSDKVQKWKRFKEELSQYTSAVRPADIAHYGKLLFEQIHSIQSAGK